MEGKSDRWKPPDWYTDMVIAKYLGIPVPDIVNIPVWWKDKAVIAMNAEQEAQKEIDKRNQPRGGS